MPSPDLTELADLLVQASAAYYRRDVLALEPDLQGEKCRLLNSYGVLSLGAIGAILGISAYKVEQHLEDHPKPKSRGTLNPKHLSMLAYSLSKQRINDLWLQTMIDGGTTISTIRDLTGIPEPTLRRHKGNL